MHRACQPLRRALFFRAHSAREESPLFRALLAREREVTRGAADAIVPHPSPGREEGEADREDLESGKNEA